MGNGNTKPDFKELSKGTKFSMKELQEWYKKFKKDFPTGKINCSQFVVLYQKMFGAEGTASDEFCEHVFKQYDSDGNGTIDFDEFMTTLSVASRGTTDEKLLWAFKLYDKDSNGFLVESEVVDILTAVYKSRSVENAQGKAQHMAKKILKKADDNGDGRLSEAEFVYHAKDSSDIKDMLQGF